MGVGVGVGVGAMGLDLVEVGQQGGPGVWGSWEPSGVVVGFAE